MNTIAPIDLDADDTLADLLVAEHHVTLNPDGGILCEGPLVEGKRHGTWVWYHGNGLVHARIEFCCGQRHGRFQTWHANGTRKTVGSYHLGEREGRWSEWHASGALEAQAEYSNGSASGRWKRWDDSGRLVVSRSYRAQAG
jgi:antitoxin component YwqK of YwqJK toxin-antitoxin module